MKSRWLILLGLVVAISACTKKNDTQVASNEIVLGEVGSLTGSEATFGISTKEGVQLAIDQLNASGGIKGKKLRAIVMDDQGKPEEAATAVTKLITQDKVVAILGEVASSKSLAMAPIAQANKIPMVTPSSTNPKVTQVGDYIFRVCFIDPFQGSVMAKFAASSLKIKKVAILRDVKNDYSMGLANFFVETFKKLGGEIVIDQSYSQGDVDFKAQLTSIRSKNPEAIYVPGYYTEVGLIARQTRELGLTVPLMGGDGWDSEKLTDIGGKALNGGYFSNHYSPDDKTDRIQKFITEYKSAYHKIPDGLAAMGYDAMIILADAMKRAPSLAGNDIRQALSELKTFPAVTGTITMDKDRNAIKSAVIIEVKDGKFIYKETIQPNS